jgi:hypothetical protein
MISMEDALVAQLKRAEKKRTSRTSIAPSPGDVSIARGLAPALLGIGQLFDAANTVLNRDQTTAKISVTATGLGSFEISFDVLQSIASQITSFFAGEHITVRRTHHPTANRRRRA